MEIMEPNSAVPKFKYLDHTSEAKFQAYGKTLEEAFANAVLAMYNMLTDIKKVKQVVRKEIEIKAPKLDTLLFDFLDQFVILLDTEGLIVSYVDSLTITKKFEMYTLKAIVKGDSYKAYDAHGSLKAITYNDMIIKEQKNGLWIVQVVVDI
ncbi:archease [Candidatus Woesearchaeota archaeon]|nr:archease [Candidatus Woesearchaeota archaeon]